MIDITDVTKKKWIDIYIISLDNKQKPKPKKKPLYEFFSNAFLRLCLFD